MFSRNDSNGAYRQVPHHEFSDDSSDEEGEDFVQRSIRNQREQMKRQDQGLEMLSQHAEKLGQMSLTISEELGQQNQMLDDMENDLETATENLDLVTRKTREMIQKAGGTKNFLLILTLIAVAVVLFLLIIYT